MRQELEGEEDEGGSRVGGGEGRGDPPTGEGLGAGGGDGHSVNQAGQ